MAVVIAHLYKVSWAVVIAHLCNVEVIIVYSSKVGEVVIMHSCKNRAEDVPG